MACIEDYIERFGLTHQQLTQLAEYLRDQLDDNDNVTITLLTSCQNKYDQRVFTMHHRDDNEWTAFCQGTADICGGAQKAMTLEQYRVFHATGHLLDPEVVFYFLCYPNAHLHREVFRYEPEESFKHPKVSQILNQNAEMSLVLQEELHRKEIANNPPQMPFDALP